jgi:hypothetical protein
MQHWAQSLAMTARNCTPDCDTLRAVERGVCACLRKLLLLLLGLPLAQLDLVRLALLEKPLLFLQLRFAPRHAVAYLNKRFEQPSPDAL